MQIDNMRVAIRPMSTSQAVDLGFMMARQWFIPLWRVWVGMALPIFLVIYVLIIGIAKVADFTEMEDIYNLASFGGVLFWWLKPLYEKPLINWLGQALFSDDPNPKPFIKDGWKNFFQYAIKLLFRYRFSTSRQLILPILMLEHPESKQFKQRHRLLQRGQGSGVTWHTIIMSHIEMIMSVGILTFLYGLIPQNFMNVETLLAFMENSPIVLLILWAILYFFIISVVAPFFVCGGFAIYLTKRCMLEGWDIELTFKQLQNRYLQAQSNPFIKIKSSSGNHHTGLRGKS